MVGEVDVLISRVAPCVQRTMGTSHLTGQELQEMWGLSLGWEDLPEEEMGTRCSSFAGIIPWREKPGKL